MNMDAWDGYPAARERLFAGAQAAGANLVSLAGDTHNAWASDLVHRGKPVGVEFAGQSVTSPGFESYYAAVPPEQLYTEGPLVHEFPRTVSRLTEMQSAEYLAEPHRTVDTHLT